MQLALRAGNEKDDSEQADTVGCCSLRVEHLKLHEQLDGKEVIILLLTYLIYQYIFIYLPNFLSIIYILLYFNTLLHFTLIHYVIIITIFVYQWCKIYLKKGLLNICYLQNQTLSNIMQYIKPYYNINSKCLCILLLTLTEQNRIIKMGVQLSGRAIDCRSIGHQFNSGCPLLCETTFFFITIYIFWSTII